MSAWGVMMGEAFAWGCLRLCFCSESSYDSLLENDIVYRGLSHRLWDISNQNIKKDADSAEI